jgi:hypothetical protein
LSPLRLPFRHSGLAGQIACETWDVNRQTHVAAIENYDTKNYNTQCLRKAFNLRAFKTKPFARFAESLGIADDDLCSALGRISLGSIDADLGGGVIKQRIARQGGGKSGGFRTIILFRSGSNAFFVYGFAKNKQANIGPDELKVFRRLAGEMLKLTVPSLALALGNGTISEIFCNE